MSYEDSNRAFVQAFFSRSVLTFEEARPMLAAIFSVQEKKQVHAADITQDDFNSMISAANDALSQLDYEIRSTLHQTTRERYYALVNTTSDALTQVATIHTTDEIGYVKRLLDEMFEANNTEGREAMCIAGKDALNLARAGRREIQDGNTQARFNMTAGEAEVLLAKLVLEGWLEKSTKGFYSLTPRALMELKGWLIETYNDEESDLRRIKFCEACKEIVTTGQRCLTRGCPCRLHDICTQHFFRIRRARTCPLCDADWDGKHYVGEKAITTSDTYLRGKRRSGARLRASEEVEENSDEDD